VFLENEPRYWDKQCDQQGRNLWADFNPGTVAAARQAGLELNPADGLAPAELAWLFRNVGRYNQETVNGVARALSRQMPALNLPVYTHALEYPDFTFPGKPLNHTQSEWAYAKGARTGIEGVLNMPGDFNRVREWGRWANVNREEGGWPTDLSLWDLRISYMMGADLYNSYNWHSSSNRLAYVEEFLRELPVVRLPPARAECTATNQIRIATPMKLQAFTRVELPVEVRETFKGRLTLVVADAVRTHTAVNLARGAKVSASSVDSTDGYSVTSVNDGNTSTACGPPMSWANRAGAQMPQWVELDFGTEQTFNTVEVLTSEGYELRDFQVQYRSSTDWLAAGEPVADNTEVQRTITFATVTASRLRIACNRGPACQPEFVRVNEVEVYNEVEPQASRGDFCPSMPATVDLAPGRHVVAFDFPTPAESRYQRRALLTLSCEPDGAAGAGAVALSADSATGLMLALDLRAQRALSLWVINGAPR
jgi:molybdopterin-binding protein